MNRKEVEFKISGIRNVLVLALILTMVLVANGCASYYAKQHREKGGEYLLAEDKENAIQEYQKSLEYEPSAQTNKELADVYKSKGDCLSSLKYYQESVKSEVLRKDSLLNLAECYTNLKMYPEAIENYVLAIELDPTDDEVAVKTANVWSYLDKDKNIIAWIDRVIAAQPDKHYGHAFKANHYYRTGKLKEAKQEYEKALQIFPRSPSLLLRLGSCLSQLGDYETARNMFEKSDEQEESQTAKLQIAVTYFMERNFDKALELSLTILSKDSKNPQANALTAQILYLQDNYNESYKYGEVAAQSIKDSAVLYKLLGVIKTTENKFPEAIKWYNLHNSINDEDAEVYFGLGTCYMKTNDNLSAIASLNKAIYLDNNFAEAYKLLGIIKFNMKDYRDSAAKLSIAVDKLQKDGEAYLYLGMANFEIGPEGFDVALAVLKEAANLAPEQSEPYAYIAAIYAYLKENDKAIESIKKAAELGYSNALFLEKEYFSGLKRRAAFLAAKEKVLQNSNNSEALDLVPLSLP